RPVPARLRRSPLAGKGDQERSQRDARRRSRISATRSPDPDQALCSGIPARKREPGPGRAEGRQHPRREGFANKELLMPSFTVAFVTGATGLLGNNLVRALAERGHRVKALVRSRAKANEQFAGLPLEVIEGDMNDVSSFKEALRGVDVLFHTAAFFRDSYKGGRHWDELFRTNVEGTEALLAAAYEAGVRRMVHTSSGGVLDGPPGAV